MQNALSWFVGVLAGCQVNPKTVLVDVIVALVVTFLSATLYLRSSGLTFLAVLLGLIPLTLLFLRCLLVAQLAVLLGGHHCFLCFGIFNVSAVLIASMLLTLLLVPHGIQVLLATLTETLLCLSPADPPRK